MKKNAKYEALIDKTILFIEIELRKRKISLSRDVIQKKYINHPYMT